MSTNETFSGRSCFERAYQMASTSPDVALRALDEWWIDSFVVGRKILELGCGDGTSTRMLLSKSPVLEIVEKDPVLCSTAGARLGTDRLAIYNMSYEHFVPDGQYDDIVFARSLDQVDDPVPLLRRIRDWVSSPGRLHVVVQNAESLHRRIGMALGRLPALTHLSERDISSNHKRVYTKAALVADLENAGWQVVFCRGYLLKPFDYDNLGRLDVPLASTLIPALYRVGQTVPDELCCQLYALCRPEAGSCTTPMCGDEAAGWPRHGEQ
jgi:trans-aconitate methyltransferase